MLKFKGKPWQIKGYIEYLKYKYGAKATISEIITKMKEVK